MNRCGRAPCWREVQAAGEPVVEKELAPEISGIVISAQGGGNASVAEGNFGSEQALFGLPAHKIKVLKRVE